MIKPERLAQTFKMLVETDSESKAEGVIAEKIRQILLAMGAETIVDGAAGPTGSNTGNLIAKFKGTTSAAPLLLNAHMDTVRPGCNVRAVLQDGVFTSDGTTILGADDKSAIAILLEAVQVLQENQLPHGPLELVLTVCEEIGLLGAKHLDFDLVSAPFGYALDATDLEGIVCRAPSANRLRFTVHGKDAHAGAAPEKGINAIVLAARAIATSPNGRIDQETTCNIGVIKGGTATNIVAKRVVVEGEVRSHDETKLQQVTDQIGAAFHTAVETAKTAAGSAPDEAPSLEVSISPEFPRTHIPDDHPVVRLAQNAASNLGRRMVTKASGGGADANIFFSKGIVTGVLGTGMRDMHTVRENIRLDDMVHATELVLEIIKLHAQSVPS